MEPKSIKEIVDEIDISKYPEDLPIDYRSVSTRFVPNAMKGMTLDTAIEVMNVFEDRLGYGYRDIVLDPRNKPSNLVYDSFA